MGKKISLSQIEPIVLSSLYNAKETVKQKIVVYGEDSPSTFQLTYIPSDSRIARSYMYINGIMHEERTASNPNGEFYRVGTNYTFIDKYIQSGDTIVIEAEYYTNVNNDLFEPTVITNRALNFASTVDEVIGDINIDPNNYFERYTLLNYDYNELFGVAVNGVTYTHSSIMSYSPMTKQMNISGIDILDSDTVDLFGTTK